MPAPSDDSYDLATAIAEGALKDNLAKAYQEIAAVAKRWERKPKDFAELVAIDLKYDYPHDPAAQAASAAICEHFGIELPTSHAAKATQPPRSHSR